MSATQSNSAVNIFEQASRIKLRFPSVRGPIMAEDLWDVKLTAKDEFSLDAIAREINRNLKAEGEETFVATKPNPARVTLELQLEIVKYVIASIQADIERAANSAVAATQIKYYEGLLNKKSLEADANLSPEEIQERINNLKAAA